MSKTIRKLRKYRINVKELCEARGIDTPYALWQKIGGSKATTASFWRDEDLKMIRLNTVNKLCNELGIKPEDLFKEVNPED